MWYLGYTNREFINFVDKFSIVGNFANLPSPCLFGVRLSVIQRFNLTFEIYPVFLYVLIFFILQASVVFAF